MSTWTDVTDYIKTQLRPGVLGNTDVQKILNSILAVINQINAGDIDPQNNALWKADISYAADVQPVLWQDTWLVSNIANNLGNVPISTSGVVHPSWRVIGSSSGSGIRIWEPIVYPNTLEIVFINGGLYYLNRAIVGPDPFVSVDFDTELAANKWLVLTGGGGNIGKRVETVELVINSDISGDLLLAKWYNNANALFEILNLAITFAGKPTTGNFRWDLGIGNDDGSFTLLTGTEGVEALKPAVPATSVVLFEILWNDAGESQTTTGTSDWSTKRFATAVQANTTGKYSKIAEFKLSKSQDYSFTLDYGSPSTLEKNKAGRLQVAFVTTDAKVVHGITVTMETVGFSAAGDFVLIELSGGKVGLYHKSTNYWMRLQWRVTFNNTAVKESDFISGNKYEALPAGTNWQSVVFGGADLTNYYTKAEIDPIDSTGSEIVFDRPRTYGSRATPITTATLTMSGTRRVTQKIFHQAASFNPPASWAKLDDGVPYDSAKINLITVEYISSTNQTYNIMHYV